MPDSSERAATTGRTSSEANNRNSGKGGPGISRSLGNSLVPAG